MGLLPLFFACSSQPEVEAVARVGNLYIGREEFELSYEFNPYFINISDPLQAKNLLLTTLIAEKLVVQESNSQTLTEWPAIKQLSEQYKREALIEQFWQKEIRGKIEITDREIYKAYLQSKKTRYFKFITFQDKKNAGRAYQHLINGLDFSEVAKLNGLDSRFIPVDSVSFGSELTLLEKQVFDLPVNGISEPFKLGQYYFIINLITEKTDIFTSEADYKRQYKNIKKIILQRKQLKSLQEYISERFSEPPYRLDRKNFKNLVQEIEKVVTFSKEPYNPPHVFPFKEITDQIGNILDKKVVSFNDGPVWSNRELLERMKVSPYPIEYASPGKFRSSMIAATKMILDDEILVHLAVQENLDRTAYVSNQERIWHEYLIYEAMRRKIYRSSSIEAAAQDTNRTEYVSARFDTYLCELGKKFTIQVDHALLDSLKLFKTDMAVIKRHFPLRSLIPLVQPLSQTPGFNSFISEKLIQK